MRNSFFSLHFCAILIGLFSSIVLAAPSPRPRNDLTLVKRTGNYPDDDAIRAAWQANGRPPTVFFSNIGQDQDGNGVVDQFAASIGGQTFRLAFGYQPNDPSRTFTDRWAGPGDTEHTGYKEFAGRFCEIMAQQTSGVVYVVLRDITGANGPTPISTWILIERPALEANPNVQKIVRVDPTNFNNQQDLWVRTKRDVADDTMVERDTGDDELAKRDFPFVWELDWKSPGDGPYWLGTSG